MTSSLGLLGDLLSPKKVNNDLTFTLDLKSLDVALARELVGIATGFGTDDLAVYGMDTQILLGNRFMYIPSMRTLEFELRGGRDYIAVLRDSNSGKIASAYILPNFVVRDIAQGLDISEETVCLVEGHMSLKRNYLVSDNDDVHKAAHKYFKQGFQHVIRPDRLESTLKRLQRRHGRYYTGPHQTITPRMFYYMEIMHELLPAYQPMWSTVVWGTDPANLEPDLTEFAQSLSDRAMSLLQVGDDLEEQAHEAADNGARWEMLNLLQYFSMLATGLLDNLAWLTAIRYGFYHEFMDIEANRNFAILKVRRDPNGQFLPNRFHYRIQASNRKLYNLFLAAQDLMDVLYPIRDSIQHRLVLPTLITTNVSERWRKVQIGLPIESYIALQSIETRIPGSMVSWGDCTLALPSRPYIEPSKFAKKAMTDLFTLVQASLELLDFPSLLISYPDLHAKALKPRSDLLKERS